MRKWTGVLLLALSAACCSSNDVGRGVNIELRPAPKLAMAHDVDCNSPAFWRDGQIIVFNSAGHPWRASGKTVFELGKPQRCEYDNKVGGGRWIEAVWPDRSGAVYGWYHFEPAGLVPGTTLTAPRIGAVKSTDGGATWKDLGIVMEARPNTLRGDAQNGYFAGGHGDFSVVLDPDEKWLYLFYGNYAGDVSEQGVSVARMEWKDRDTPVGRILKWHEGSFKESGVGGWVTPIFSTFTAWERADCDSYWGPSVHWNTHLGCYVMLLNRARGKGWVQEGIYVSFSNDLSDPRVWSAPKKIHSGGRWYPQVMGLEPGGTDKLAGRVARFFMQGSSEHEIVFTTTVSPR